MSGEDTRLFRLLTPGADCQQQLQTTVDAIEAGNRDVREIDSIVADCANEEPELALVVIETLVQEEHILASRIERSLQAIGSVDTDLAHQFFDKAVDSSAYPQAYIADYVAYLFAHDIDALCDSLKEWYWSSPRFFELAVERVLGAYHEGRTGQNDLENNGEEVVETLIEIAEAEGIDVSSALTADTDDTLVKGSLILDDFRHLPSNLDSYGIGVDYDIISKNAES